MYGIHEHLYNKFLDMHEGCVEALEEHRYQHSVREAGTVPTDIAVEVHKELIIDFMAYLNDEYPSIRVSDVVKPRTFDEFIGALEKYEDDSLFEELKNIEGISVIKPGHGPISVLYRHTTSGRILHVERVSRGYYEHTEMKKVKVEVTKYEPIGE